MEIVRLIGRFVSESYSADNCTKLWHAWLNALQPMSPDNVWRSGDLIFPPPPSKGKITLILSNHICDMDIILINLLISEHSKTANPVKLAGFTYELFRYVPGAGMTVGRMLIGLKKKESEESLKSKIQFCLDQGYNTFLLFPEGALFHEESYQHSLKHQTEKKTGTLMHDVLYPRFGALDAFLDLVKDRLECVVDLTLHYQNFDPRSGNWSHTDYPGALFSLFNNIPAPFFHAKNMKIKDWRRVRDHDFLIKLWKRKNERIALLGKNIQILKEKEKKDINKKDR